MCYVGVQPVSIPDNLDLSADWGRNVPWEYKRYGAGVSLALRRLPAGVFDYEVERLTVEPEGYNLIVKFIFDVEERRRVRVEAAVAIYVSIAGLLEFHPRRFSEEGRIRVWGATDKGDSTQYKLRDSELAKLKTRVINTILIKFLVEAALVR